MTPPKNETIFGKEGLLEHLERETDPNLSEDLDLLLRNSISDRREFAQLKATRELVKRSDDVLLPESGLYFDNLHDRIMAAIEQEPLKRPNIMPSRMGRRFNWGAFAGAAGMTMMIAVVSWISVKTTTQPLDIRSTAAIEKSDDRFDRDLANVMADVSDPEMDLSSELNGFETESEFVTAAVEEKLKNLTPDQAEALFASLEK